MKWSGSESQENHPTVPASGMLGNENLAMPLQTVSCSIDILCVAFTCAHFRHELTDGCFGFFFSPKVPEMARPIVSSTRSQDDAMVSYIFQRPPSESDFQNTFSKHHSRWLGDESIAEVSEPVIEIVLDVLLTRLFSTRRPSRLTNKVVTVWQVKSDRPL